MKYYSEAGILAIVLAINLVLLGALLAGGLTLVFRFIENAAPRGRYVLAVLVFALAIFLPLAAALKAPSVLKAQNSLPKTIVAPITETNNAVTDSAVNLEPESIVENYPARQTSIIRENVISNLDAAPEKPSKNFFDDFVMLIGASVFGKIFAGIWLAGTLFLLFREGNGLFQLRKTQKSWRLATGPERSALLCPAAIRLYFDEQQSPGTVGLFRPRIVLPAGFSRELSLASRQLILQHELSHAFWRDPLINFLLRTARALFWISPALWLLERLIDSEREAAADQSAIRSLSGESEYQTIALNYADILITAARELKTFGRQNHRPQAIGFGSASELENRVRRLLLSSQTTVSHIVSAFVACALTLATIAVVPLAGFSGKYISSKSETAERADQPENARTYLAINDSPIALPTLTPPPAAATVNSENGKTNKASASKIESRDKSLPLLPPPASSGDAPATTETLPVATDRPSNTTEDFYNHAASREANDVARKLSDEDARRAATLKAEPPPAGLNSARTFTGMSPLSGVARNPMKGFTEMNGNFQPLNKLGINSEGSSEATTLKATGEADRRAAQTRNYPSASARAETYRTPYTSGYSPEPLPSPPPPARAQP